LTVPNRKRLFGFLDPLTLLLHRVIENLDIFKVALGMTLVLLMLYTNKFWYLNIPLTILCSAAVLHPPLRVSPNFWFIVTIIVAVGNYHNWYTIDNHQYLITYWCLALYCGLLTPNPTQTIKITARLLIGLCFLFATLWKVISIDYLDGTFFHYSLLMDDRFSNVAVLFRGLTSEAFLQNHQVFDELLKFDSLLHFIQLQDSPQLFWLAKFATRWTIGIEGLIAIAFLWPAGSFISRWRDFPLLLFLLTTYLVAPVIGFGWVLIAMGLTQCTSTFKYTRLLYLLAFFIIQIYLIPWSTIVGYYFF
jgi:hypothetical protein